MKDNITVIAVVLIVAIVIIVGCYLGLKRNEVEALKAVRQTEIEQREKTERSEEWSQFFKKAVPWGKFEEEDN